MYEIGVMDDGTLIGISRPEMEASLRTLELMASELGATVMVLRTITLASPPVVGKMVEIEAAGKIRELEDVEDIGGGGGGGGRAGKEDLATVDLTEQEIREREKKLRYTEKRNRKYQKETQRLASLSGLGTLKTGSGAAMDGLEEGISSTSHLTRKSNPAQPLPLGATKLRRIAKMDSRFEDSSSDEDIGEGENKSKDMQQDLLAPTPTPAPTAFNDVFSDNGIPASWKERNIARAQLDHKWRMSGNGNINGNSNAEGHGNGGGSTPIKKKRIRNRRSSKKEWNGDIQNVSESDDTFMFDIEGLPSGEGVVKETTMIRPPLTEAALTALSQETSPVQPSDPPFLSNWLGGSTGASKSLASGDQTAIAKVESANELKRQRRREMKAQKKEQRRLDLLRGDGMADGSGGMFDMSGGTSSSDDQSDSFVKNMVKRHAMTGGHGIMAEPRSPPRKHHLAPMATSPTSTIKGFSANPLSVFALRSAQQQIPTVTSDSNTSTAPIPSPSDTIILPLDSLSLSFAQAEICTVTDGASLSDDEFFGIPTANREDGPAIEGLPRQERLCVEAIVVKKMDIDETFGFLDFGSAAV